MHATFQAWSLYIPKAGVVVIILLIKMCKNICAQPITRIKNRFIMQSDSKRDLVEKLLAVWRQYPTLRLVQLVSNISYVESDPYFMTDQQFSKMISEYATHIAIGDSV